MFCLRPTRKSAIKLAVWGAAWIVSSGLTACNDQKDTGGSKPNEPTQPFEPAPNPKDTNNMKNETKKATVRRLIVSRQNAGRLGTVDFDESHRATLSPEGSGPAVEQLKKDWQEVSSMKELIWKQSRPDEIDGKSVTRIVGVTAKPGDANYFYAVLDTLSRKYGYSVDIAK